MAEGATVANAFVQVMPSMEGATSSLTSALVPEFSKAGNTAAAGFGSMFAGKLGGVLKGAAGALAGVFAIGAIKDAFTTVEAGFNNVKIATGATGEAANELKDVYLEVSKNVTGSFEDIGSAVGEINTRLGLNGEELEKASESMMKYAKITGQDATKATQDVASMMRNVGIPTTELADTLGKLTVAGQAAGIDVSSLANNVTKYNAVMKQLGLTTDEQIALMAQFEVSGADTASILNAMKKGVATWAKEGKDARVEFENFVKGVQDGTVTAGDAVEIFGSKGGLSMYEAASKGQLSFDEMFKAISGASSENLDAIYMDTLTLEEKLDILGKNFQAAFFEILEPIVDALMPYIDMALAGITSIVGAVTDMLTPAFEQFGEMIAPIIDSILPELDAVFVEITSEIGSIVAEIWPVIQETIVSAMEIIGGIISDIWPIAKDIIVTAIQTVSSIVKTAWPAISRVIKSAMETIKAIVDFVWPYVRETISTVVNVVKSIVDKIWPAIASVVEGAASRVSAAIDGLRGIVNVVSGIFDGVKSAIEDPIKAAKDFIGRIVSDIERLFSGLHINIPSFELPHVQWHWEDIGGILSLPVFDGISWWAKGGFADEATLSGYGEKGLELYWPSYDPYFDKYAKGIAEHMPASAGGVDIHDCTFIVREKDDIRRVAEELNTLIQRQDAGALA